MPYFVFFFKQNEKIVSTKVTQINNLKKHSTRTLTQLQKYAAGPTLHIANRNRNHNMLRL